MSTAGAAAGMRPDWASLARRARFKRGAGQSALLAFLSNHAQFSVWLLMPFFLVGPLGLTPTVGGLVFALTPLANALVAPLGGWATDMIVSARDVRHHAGERL